MNHPPSYDVVICGAGIAGISAAFFLKKRSSTLRLLLLDERLPLSLTSDKSTECYRNWWPGPGDAMVALMNHSIDLLEELANSNGNLFRLNRRGYLYVTSDPARARSFQSDAQSISSLGAGSLRVHDRPVDDSSYRPSAPDGFIDQPTGTDLILDPPQIRRVFPFLSKDILAVLHVRRAGWFSSQQLGMFMLEQARSAGLVLAQEHVVGLDISGGRLREVRLASGRHIPAGCFVNAAGPYLNEVSRMAGLDLPVFAELHLKAAFDDYLHVIRRDAPLLINVDPQQLSWTPEERSLLAEDEETRWLLGNLLPGAHARPEGGEDSRILLLLWEPRIQRVDLSSPPPWPPPLDPFYLELALRGLSAMIPGLATYLERSSRPRLDGGYYIKTPENRPLIGPTPVEGLFMSGALSGFGLMAACAAGELLAAHIFSGSLPAYAPAFTLSRYNNPVYLHLLETWGETGQL